MFNTHNFIQRHDPVSRVWKANYLKVQGSERPADHKKRLIRNPIESNHIAKFSVSKLGCVINHYTALIL